MHNPLQVDRPVCWSSIVAGRGHRGSAGSWVRGRHWRGRPVSATQPIGNLGDVRTRLNGTCCAYTVVHTGTPE